MWRREKKIEETLALEDIDPVTCQTVLKGEIDKYGRCIVKVKVDPNNPNRVELEKLKFVEIGHKRSIVATEGEKG